MKKSESKNLFEKFRVAELKRPDLIFGGNGDDDGTDDDSKGRQVCVALSTRYVPAPKKKKK